MGKKSSNKLNLAVVTAALLLTVLWGSACMPRDMAADAKSATGAEFSKLAPGDAVKVVIEISSATDGAIEGKLLDPAGQDSYVRSSTPIRVAFDSSIHIVMGEAKDIRQGAVIHTTGTLTKDRSVKAVQLVILTGYAKVK